MRRRGRKEAYLWPSFPAKKGSFFKIIHSSIIRDQQLGIPRKFIQKFGKDLSDVAVLKVPNGEIRCVEIRKANGQIWFHNGWREFVEYHSICAGHFLVFRYDGNSHFYVLIFDMSGSEIGYLRNCEKLEESDHGCLLIENEEENPVEILGVFPNGHDSSVKQEERVGIPITKRHSCAKASARMRRPVSSKAIQAARAFKSKRPFFTVILHTSYLTHRFLPIPSTFVQKYLREKLANATGITLRDSDGRTWSVGYTLTGAARISKGLSAFLRGNNLGEGDVCVFELIKKKDIVLKASIFHC